ERLLQRVGKECLLERRIVRRGRRQLELERRELRLVKAIEPIAVGFSDFGGVLHERQPKRRKRRSAKLSKSLVLVLAAADFLRALNRGPGAAIFRLPLGSLRDLIAKHLLVRGLLRQDLRIDQPAVLTGVRLEGVLEAENAGVRLPSLLGAKTGIAPQRGDASPDHFE